MALIQRGFLTGNRNRAPDYVKSGNFALNKDSLQAQGLRNWFPANRLGVASPLLDLGPQRNNATGFDGITTSVSSHGRVLDLDGVAAYAKTDANIGISGSQNRSISCWFNQRALDNNRIFDMGGSGAGDSFGCLVRTLNHADPNKIQLAVSGGNRIWDFVNDFNEWHHITIVLDGNNANNLIAYGDGSLLTISSTAAQLITTDVAPFFIGSATNGSDFWDGQIGDISIYDYAISPTLAHEIYAKPWDLAYELGRVAYFFVPPAAPVGGRIMSSLAAHGGLAGAGGIAGSGGGLAA